MPKVYIGKAIPEGKMIHKEVNGKDILVANVKGMHYAVSNVCNHAGARLHEGKLDGKHVTCPWHKAVWDVTNGQLVSFPIRLRALEVYKVDLEGDELYIDL